MLIFSPGKALARKPVATIPGLIKLTLVSVFLLSGLSAFSQEQVYDRRYVKIIVSDVKTSEDALNVDLYLRSKTGVLTSRMDRHTSVYLCIYSESSGITIGMIRSWISELGFTSNCYVNGIHGNGESLKIINRSSCQSSEVHEIK